MIIKNNLIKQHKNRKQKKRHCAGNKKRNKLLRNDKEKLKMQNAKGNMLLRKRKREGCKLRRRHSFRERGKLSKPL